MTATMAPAVRPAEASTGVGVRLLGPVELTGDRGAVPLGGPRLRTLLGLLALRAPQVVSRDALIDGIWDCAPPGNAAKTLRAHVAYLRRGLASAGIRGLVATRSPGYRLAVPAGCVDAHRFETGVGAARTASACGALDATVEHLRSALELWRGDVLADCATGEWARAEAARLREVRLYATEELLSAELALGRHARAAAELECLVGRHPLRERLWELLIVALDRTGRQADALHAYRRARDRLVEELGVQPGSALRRLQAAILSGDQEVIEAATTAVLPRPPVGTAATATGGGQPAACAAPSAPQPAPATVPAPVNSIIGRDTQIAQLRELLATRRLVTLTGVGGCGKTRLAVAVAEAVAGRYADGVRFVDLTPVADREQLLGAVSAAFGVPAEPTAGPQSLAPVLQPRQCLLVLDNCEHLVPACRWLVEPLLRWCPTLRVLATSREMLGVRGETTWPVPPLATPPHPPDRGLAGGALAEVCRYDAVRLFLDRATAGAVRDLTDSDAPAIAAVCARLDGLPLAIELAAARTSVLTVTEIAERLHDPALLLAGGCPDRPHHQTLDATVAWSYRLLDEPMRARLRRLSAFAGGFTLAAAEAVWPQRRGAAAVDVPGGAAAVEVLGGAAAVEVLGDLVAKSLVVMERGPTGARYRMLETLRRWTAERLAEHPDEERDTRRRHAGYYLSLAEEADRRLRGPEVGAWLERLAVEHANLQAALAWHAHDGADPVAALRLGVALAGYCRLRGRYGEGRRWLDDALDRCPGAPPHVAGQALASSAQFALLVGDYREAQARAEQALELQRAHGDSAGAAGTLRLLASVARERGQYARSLAWLDLALRSCAPDGHAPGSHAPGSHAPRSHAPGSPATNGREHDGGAPESRAVADVLQLTGFTAWLAGDLDRAGPLLAEAARHYQRLGDLENQASTGVHQAAVALYRGQPWVASRVAGAALTRFTALDVKEGIAWTLNILGLVALHERRAAEAVATLRASLEVHLAVGDRWRQASLLEALAAALLAGGQPARAAELYGLASRLRATLGTPVPAVELPTWRATQARLRSVLSADGWHAARARGAAADVPDLLAALDAAAPTRCRRS
ncbi:MAG TPA: BTAD domain-containing putative transcriptional regulator [Micromonosporaceae bacterium]|nr:BTAD domain-containing putative transcriptional regulator [Micromonosporaceae bacterium]